MEYYEEGVFPTKEQELLLKAALLDDSVAVSAWEEWKSKVDFEGHLDNGSFRLLPLLYKNLQCHNVKDPLMDRLKGIYRMAWYENERLFYDISKVLSYLNNSGIRTMVLKGAALTVVYYKNYGVRPMADIDVLVPTSQASLTINLLKRAGWTPTTKSIEEDLLYRHSMQFKDQNGREMDLHWHVLYESCWENSDKDFWDESVSIKVKEIPTLTLNPTDTLLHIIVHGIMWNSEPPIRWIADAISIINSSDTEVDWERLINLSKKHLIVLRLKKALKYLNDNFHAQIPSSVMNELRKTPLSPIEKFEYRYIMSSQKNALLGEFPGYIIHYLRLSDGTGFLSKLIGFPKFLQYQYGVKNRRKLLLRIATASVRRINKKLSFNSHS